MHARSRCICFWHGCDRGQSLHLVIFAASKSPQVFTGNFPFSDVTAHVAVAKIMDGERPDRPHHPCLTDPLWDITRDCWHQDHVHRPAITKVVKTLREWQVFPLFVEPSSSSSSSSSSSYSFPSAVINNVLRTGICHLRLHNNQRRAQTIQEPEL